MMDVIYYVAASLDGYIATPDGGVAWLAPFEHDGEDYGYAEFYASVDALLMGSATYERTLSFGAWPYEGKPCRVFSRQEHAVPTHDVEITDATPDDVLHSLSRNGCRRAWLVGGGVLAASFLQRRFVSEYIVSVVPIILGGGIPMISPNGIRESLTLLETRVFTGGIMQVRYRSEGH